MSPSQNPNQHKGDEHVPDVSDIISVLRDNRDALFRQINDLDHKLDEIPDKLDQIRREQVTSIDKLRGEFQAGQADLRRELASMFVPRTEYDPKHSIMVERVTRNETQIDRLSTVQEGLTVKVSDHVNISAAKFQDYDRMVQDGRGSMQSFIVMQQEVAALKAKMDRIEGRGWTNFTKVAAIAAFLISLLGFLAQFIQHITFTP
jgi:cell division protein FtsB